MKQPKFRVLVVDDYAPWSQYVTSTLHKHPEFIIVGEASDGLAAVGKAQELQPDLILLDIGLPKLNGIEAARQIRKLASNSKILFITENHSSAIAQEALRTGARGYFLKSDAARELLPAIRAVLQGKQFVSARFAGRDIGDASPGPVSDSGYNEVPTAPAENSAIIRGRHEVGLYSNDGSLVEKVTQFIGAALKAGNPAVAVATEAHRHSLLSSLRSYAVDVDAAMKQGRYLAVDAAETITSYMSNGMPDADRFRKAFGDLILKAKASTEKHSRVAVFGEGVNVLWEQGKEEAAIQVEKLGNELIKEHDLDILCGYSRAAVPDGMQSRAFQLVCTEHSAVYSC